MCLQCFRCAADLTHKACVVTGCFTATALFDIVLCQVENRVFNDYIYVAQEDEDDMKCTHDLPFPQKLSEAIQNRTNGEGPKVLPCTAIAWNATGSILAAT